ncbi:hypothetical protein KKH43_06520 [Patescibacteria group bacterium]|nr:hypothetical protein [Patescibacteria group bacterium]
MPNGPAPTPGQTPPPPGGAPPKAPQTPPPLNKPPESPKQQAPPAPMPTKPQAKSGGALKTILFAAIGFILGAAIAGGGIYFWLNTSISALQNQYTQEKSNLEAQVSNAEQLAATAQSELTTLQTELDELKAELEKQTAGADIVDAMRIGSEKIVTLDDGTSITVSEVLTVALEDKEGAITSIVQSETDPTLLYVGIVSVTGNTVDSAIYSYNTDTEKAASLFEESLTESEYLILGLDGDNLILLKQPMDYSPGPCANMWDIAGKADVSGVEYYTLDTTADTEELIPYTVPENKIKLEDEKTKVCSEDQASKGGDLKIVKRIPQGYYQEKGDLTEFEVQNPLKTISLYFENELDEKTINEKNVQVKSSTGGEAKRTIEFDTNEKKLVITVSDPIVPAKATEEPVKVTVTLTGLEDTEGNSLKGTYEYYIDLKEAS